MPKEIHPKGEPGSVLSCACKVFLLPGSILATKLCPMLVHGSCCAKSRQRLLQQHQTQGFLTDQTSLSQWCWVWESSSFPTGSRASVAETASCLFEDLDLNSSHPSLPSGHKEACNRLQYVLWGSWWKWRHGETQMFKEMSFPGSKSDWQWSRKGNRKDYGPFPWIYWHTFCGILTDWKLLKLECRQHALSSRLPVVVCFHPWSTFKYKGLLS